MDDSASVTQLLVAWGRGDKCALEQLTPKVHDELRKLARAYLSRGRPNQTLQPTALTNEAYVRLLEQDKPVEWENRAHFFGIAARLMRIVLVDYSRARRAAKRGGDAQAARLVDSVVISPGRAPDVIEVDQALDRLAEVDER